MHKQKNTVSDGARYSLNKNAKSELHKALYDTKYEGEILLRDNTPQIMLSQKGVKDHPMSMNASHIRENVFTEAEAKKLGLKINEHTHYHGLGDDFFLKIIDGLDNVTEAYRGTKNAENTSRTENYFLLISEFKNKDGDTINVPVYIDEKANVNRAFIDVNKISTVFGRDNFRDYISRQIHSKNLVRIKNRSTADSESSALIAKDYINNASNNTIPQPNKKVNTQMSLSSNISPLQSQYAKADSDTEIAPRDKNITDYSTGYAYGETYFTMSYNQDGKVVGTLEYGVYEGEPNIKMIEVSPEYRRKGIGTKLYLHQYTHFYTKFYDVFCVVLRVFESLKSEESPLK